MQHQKTGFNTDVISRYYNTHRHQKKKKKISDPS